MGTVNYQVRMELSQRLVMEGEGFQANLTLENLFADQSVDNIQINLIIQNDDKTTYVAKNIILNEYKDEQSLKAYLLIAAKVPEHIIRKTIF